MGLNETPNANRTHIGIFGRRNAGKSSLLNAVTGQDLAVVSEVAGTTTDPVSKAMELLPLGPVLFIDTPGFDDEGELGEKRVQKTRALLGKIDVALLVTETEGAIDSEEEAIVRQLEEAKIPYIIVHNKAEIYGNVDDFPAETDDEIWVSATNHLNINPLKEKLAKKAEMHKEESPLIGDLVHPGDLIVLVIPVDSAAPKGRLILPQQQVIRDALDHHVATVCVQPEELPAILKTFGSHVNLVITDSQAFGAVAQMTPKEIPLTSFSILFARFKGVLEGAVRGVKAVDQLQEGDKVLICEGCTHHRQCDDIGTVKLPRWISEYTGKNIEFCFTSGNEFPEDVSDYQMVIHCGGCMLNERTVKSRIDRAWSQGVPATNYGILIAYLKGILPRTIQVFPSIYALLSE